MTGLSPGRPLRGDRIHRYVTAFCPQCHADDPERPLDDVRRLAGWLVVRDGAVWLERGCPDHGLVRTYYDESPHILSYLEQWQAPTKSHVPDQVSNFRPIPAAYAHGLPAMQTQHTCILVADVIEHCNLRCPTCFTASGPQLRGVASVETVLANVDARLAREGNHLDVLMLSGGEPTLYPELDRLFDELVARPIVRILLNSNGLRIAEDDELHESEESPESVSDESGGGDTDYVQDLISFAVGCVIGRWDIRHAAEGAPQGQRILNC